jgi:23S rRNA (cytosine1962-C5)-methyltransferase
MADAPQINLLYTPAWKDYELLDSGDGLKLERFGKYTFVRPEHQAAWQPRLANSRWEAATARFQATSGDETGGRWQFRQPVAESWQMSYKGLKFLARSSASRHLGVHPEQASHWDWMAERVSAGSFRALNLFGYTGLATLALAQAGAQVTHVDAAKKSVGWARENQALSGLQDKPVRWIVDDALKFVQREARRGAQYEGILLDPPKFGRGPKGEVWEVFEMLPELLRQCRAVLSDNPRFIVITAYAIRASALSLYHLLAETLRGLPGEVDCGELVTPESGGGRCLSLSIYARWKSR